MCTFTKSKNHPIKVSQYAQKPIDTILISEIHSIDGVPAHKMMKMN